jgi:GNAT superfamily N-acetyltransferase
MNITYKTNIDNVNWKTVAKLFAAVRWEECEPAELKNAFASSSHVQFAYNGEELIGFGRTVDDGKYYALIVDLVISPKYQEKGIGSKILSELKDSLVGYYFTTLISAVGKEGFYIKQGWRKQKTAFLWPRPEKQKKIMQKIAN